MTIYTDRITLVFPIDDPKKTRSAAASLQTLEITESGNEFEKLVPLDPAKVSEYFDAFNLPLIDANEKLTADLAAMTAERDASIAERDEALAEVTRLTDDRDSWRRVAEALESEKETLIAQLTASQAHATDLESQLDRVVTGAGNRRLISPRAWQARFTQDEELDLSISSDSGVIQGLMAVKSLIQSGRLFSIDHAMTEATLNSMIRVGIINEARKDNLVRDSLASERLLT